MTDNKINYLEQLIPIFSLGVFCQAYFNSLSTVNRVLEAIYNVLYKVFTDGNKKKIKDVSASVKVDISKNVYETLIIKNSLSLTISFIFLVMMN